jgi:hypothetical protein
LRPRREANGWQKGPELRYLFWQKNIFGKFLAIFFLQIWLFCFLLLLQFARWQYARVAWERENQGELLSGLNKT